MNQKLWKIFGTIGILSSVLLALFLIFLLTSISQMKYSNGGKAPYFPTTYSTERWASAPRFSLPEVSLSGPAKQESFFGAQGEIPSRMVVKTGWLSLIVKDVLGVARKISKFAEEKGGWVVSSNIFEHEKVPSGSITVRVPAENFDEAMSYFRGLATRVSNEKIQAQDITEEYVDLQSRLRNLEATESQLLELMKRTGKVSEILEVQRELTSVTQQIEQIKGKIQYLEQSVKMSSITVNLALSEELLPIPPGEKWRPKYVLLQSWKSVLGFWRWFSYFLIRAFVWAQVWVPLALLIWWGRKLWKKRKGQKVEIEKNDF